MCFPCSRLGLHVAGLAYQPLHRRIHPTVPEPHLFLTAEAVAGVCVMHVAPLPLWGPPSRGRTPFRASPTLASSRLNHISRPLSCVTNPLSSLAVNHKHVAGSTAHVLYHRIDDLECAYSPTVASRERVPGGNAYPRTRSYSSGSCSPLNRISMRLAPRGLRSLVTTNGRKKSSDRLR